MKVLSVVVTKSEKIVKMENVSVKKAGLDQIVLKASLNIIYCLYQLPVTVGALFFVTTDTISDFPTNPAAKLDIALSILTAIILISLVLCAVFPINYIMKRLRCQWRKEKRENDEEQYMGM